MKFSVNLKGRINNFPLGKQDYLLPLFEAISNSIHAIEDMKEINQAHKGIIEIEIEREKIPQLTEPEEILQPITGFIIKDNGIGFTDKNMASFMESDSSYKLTRGGKGVGRFLW
jgi:hypothetical protein